MNPVTQQAFFDELEKIATSIFKPRIHKKDYEYADPKIKKSLPGHMKDLKKLYANIQSAQEKVLESGKRKWYKPWKKSYSPSSTKKFRDAEYAYLDRWRRMSLAEKDAFGGQAGD